MKIDVLCGHRTLRRFESEWIDDYLTRIGRFADISLIPVREKERDTPEATASATWKEFERRIPSGAMKILLDESGAEPSTKEFAALIGTAAERFKGKVSFLVGGSYGFPPEAKAEAHKVVSLSKLTFPHRIALLVLVEQVYRVLSWKAGTPYHHE